MAGEFPSPGGADRFREGITFAMEMGAPPALEGEEQRATFLFASNLVWTGDSHTDADGHPFDPAIPVESESVDPVTVPCAVTYFDAQGEITNLGIVTPSRVAIDLLDIHYTQVKDAVAVVIGGDKYIYRRMEPPSGLFSVGIYTLHFDAENET